MFRDSWVDQVRRHFNILVNLKLLTTNVANFNLSYYTNSQDLFF